MSCRGRWLLAQTFTLLLDSLIICSVYPQTAVMLGWPQWICMTTDSVLQVLADPGDGETPLMPVALMHASAASVAAGQVSLHEVPLQLAVQWPELPCLDPCSVWRPGKGWELSGASM